MLDAGVARFSVRGMFAGLALGALTRWIDNLPEGWRSLALIGSPWLGLAFALGAFMVLQGGRGRGAAIVGAVATIAAAYPADEQLPPPWAGLAGAGLLDSDHREEVTCTGTRRTRK